jgi:mannose-6-phosphate isomerase-like protein (cupin superfamily)
MAKRWSVNAILRGDSFGRIRTGFKTYQLVSTIAPCRTKQTELSMFREFAVVALALLGAGNAAAYEAIAVTPPDYRALQTGRGSVEILATSEDTDGKLGIAISNDRFGGPGRSVRLSGSSQTFFVLEGTYEFYIGDKVLDGTPGTMVSVDANQTFGYFSKGAGRLLTVYSPGGFEEFFVDWAAKGIGPGPELEALERKYGITRDNQ